MALVSPGFILDSLILIISPFLEQATDKSPVPAAAKAALRTKLAAVQKRVLEDQKAAAAANKARATAAAVAAADAAVAAGQKFVVVQLEIGLDAKAALEAWNAIHKKQPSLPAAILTADQGEWLILACCLTICGAGL